MSYHKKEDFDHKTTEDLVDHYRNIIGLLGEDEKREGLIKTPQRMAKAMTIQEFGGGMHHIIYIVTERLLQVRGGESIIAGYHASMFFRQC